MTNMLTVAAAVFCLVESAGAQMVPVEWDAAGQFTKKVPIPAGKFVEACEKLTKSAKVDWSFVAASPVDFNIHFHEGKQVRFPVKLQQVSRDAGALAPQRDQDYCWMWTNKGTQDAVLSFRLLKR